MLLWAAVAAGWLEILVRFSSSCPLSLDRSGIPTLPFVSVPCHCFQLFIVPFSWFVHHRSLSFSFLVFLPPVCQSFCLLSLSAGESLHRICPNQLFCLFRIVSISNLSSCSSCIYIFAGEVSPIQLWLFLQDSGSLPLVCYLYFPPFLFHLL